MKLAYRISLAGILTALALGGLSACGDRDSGTIDALWTARAEEDQTPAPPAATGQRAVPDTAWRSPAGPWMTSHPAPAGSPTPDTPHVLPKLRSQSLQVTVRAGETLREIARRYQVSLVQLVEANRIANPDVLSVGQALQIPLPAPVGDSPAHKIIPDSEFVYSPGSAGWDVDGFLRTQNGPLAREKFDGMNAAERIELISRRYSLNPRLLLAVLDYQYGCLRQAQAAQTAIDARLIENTAAGLSLGFYLWRAGGVRLWTLQDGTVLNASPLINAGTAAVQGYFAEFYDRADWEKAIGSQGLSSTYTDLFGSPFGYALEPLLPPDLTQPVLQLPFEKGAAWSFTGGPHGGWSSYTAWAALDFAPAVDQTGCVPSSAWVMAAADGLIVYAKEGEVIQDLDGDGYWQTGWSLLYMHVSQDERVAAGTSLKAGERIGHPSCEGGVSSGTHVHIARRYNGEWIPADANLPFNLDGWVSAGTGVEYDGTLTRAAQTRTAFGGRTPDNEIQR